MRIEDSSNLGTVAAGTGRAHETQKVDSPDVSRSNTPDSGGDRVEFSSTLGRISQAISNDNAQRAGQVQTLAAAYQTGRYQPNSQATSQGMIAEAVASSYE